MQDKLKILKEKKEIMETMTSFNKDEYDKLCFECSLTESIQLSLKIYANSFYGETGNLLSSFFLRELAGGVTSAGQYNIKLVADYIEKKGFKIIYGDTDSLYIKIPDFYYSECDNNSKKIKYWEKMVNITINETKKLCNEINEYLISDNGSEYLKMAYEEVLFPAVFLGKKKYFGIPHVSIPNFYPKKIFVRGLDVIKQDKSEFFKNIGNEIMRKLMDVNNEEDNIIKIVEDIIEKKIIESYNIDIKNFILSATYKPLKQNISVHTFINRMKEKNIQIPRNGEKFDYVVVESSIKKNKGDRMEFVDTFENDKSLILDMKYYFNSIKSSCARFINNDNKFQPNSKLLIDIVDNDEYEKQLDKLSQKEAEKHIGNKINRIYENLSQDIKKYINIEKPNLKRKNTNNFMFHKKIKIETNPLKRKNIDNNFTKNKQMKINHFFKKKYEN